MGYPIKQSSTSRPLLFLMVDSGDHITAKTGLSPTVTISKAGGSFASPSGAVSEIANGWYKVAGNATDSATLGPLILHATASGADPCDVQFEVVAYDPHDANLGLTGLTSGGVTVTTNNDKTGYSLASTGLDSVSASVPNGRPTTFPGWIMWLCRRFGNKVTATSSVLTVYKDDGTTVNTTQALSDDGTTTTVATL